MRKYFCTTLGLLLFTMTFAQSSNDILNSTYHSEEAGGILVWKNEDNLNMSFVGKAHIEKNISINEETRFRMASVSKQFTAMAIYLLIREGKISFETEIRTIFPELNTINEPIKIKHLLNHSSGLADYENLIPKNQTSQLSDNDVLDLIKDIDSVYFEAGSKFRYSNTAYCLMSLIVERVSEQSYESFCKQRIFDKLDMKSAQISAPMTFETRAFGYHPNNNTFIFADQSITSATRGDGGVYIPATDFAKWMDKKNPLFTSQFFNDLKQYSIEVKDGVFYGLGLFYASTNDGMLTIFHSGESTGFHNIFLFQPDSNVGISLFTNRDDLKIASIIQEVMQDQNIQINSINQSLFLWLNKVYSND